MLALWPRVSRSTWCALATFGLLFLLCGSAWASEAGAGAATNSFPPPLDSYGDAHMTNSVGQLMVMDVLKHRVKTEPFNLIATLLFLAAVIHTFLTHQFRHLAHVLELRHKRQAAERGEGAPSVSMMARLLHFLGEVEAVFGIWVLPLMVIMATQEGTHVAVDYINHRVSFKEPIFVVVIMAMASTRPVLLLAENLMRQVARLGRESVVAWWLSILTLGPLLGSFITEPAAMTICASLLAKQFYSLKPRKRLAYATLGLLFVNISVGGTLTHFAAPPVLMVAAPWGWGTPYMITHFGWISAMGIVISNAAYFVVFRKEFAHLQCRMDEQMAAGRSRVHERPVPIWVTVVHLLFMAGAVASAHYPVLLVGSFLFFLAFFEIAEDHQGRAFQLRSPILVGFFLAGLVIHGGLQQWWIAPVLGSLGDKPLMFGAIGLTAFNDNAAITFLSTLVPNLAESMKQAVVAGAVIGGGLTVIANAPNPAGQAILGDRFEDGISPLGLLLGALLPTAIMAACFLLLKIG